MSLVKRPVSELTNEEFYEAYVEMNVQRMKQQKSSVPYEQVLNYALKEGQIKLSRYLELQNLNLNR